MWIEEGWYRAIASSPHLAPAGDPATGRPSPPGHHVGPLPGVVIDMAQHVQRVFAAARTALADADIDAARDVRQSDQRVDDLQREVFNWVQAKIPDDVDATQSAIDRLSAARKLERIADVSTNIAEDIIFLADVSLVRHADA